jgi:excisionase family DNA binding protein
LIQCTITPRGRLRPRLSQSKCERPFAPPHERSTQAIFLSPNQAADHLQVSKVTLARWRIEGHGPPFAKFGRVVRYDRAELLAWARSQTRQSTPERGNQIREAQS